MTNASKTAQNEKKTDKDSDNLLYVHTQIKDCDKQFVQFMHSTPSPLWFIMPLWYFVVNIVTFLLFCGDFTPIPFPFVKRGGGARRFIRC